MKCSTCGGMGYIDRCSHASISAEDINRYSCNDCGGFGIIFEECSKGVPCDRAGPCAVHMCPECYGAGGSGGADILSDPPERCLTCEGSGLKPYKE